MSAGSLIGTGINVIAVGLFCGVVGYLIDFIGLQSNMFNMPAQTLMTMHYVALIFYVFPFLYFVASVFHHIVMSLNEQTGTV